MNFELEQNRSRYNPAVRKLEAARGQTSSQAFLLAKIVIILQERNGCSGDVLSNGVVMQNRFALEQSNISKYR